MPGNPSNSVSSTVEVLAQLKVMHDAMGEVKTDIKGINRSQSEMLQALSRFSSRQEALERNILDITKVVRDGNGQPSIMQRLAISEQMIHQQAMDIAELKRFYNSMSSAKLLSRGQIVAGISGMIITALLSAISIAVAILT